jgi:hypothetical protein
MSDNLETKLEETQKELEELRKKYQELLEELLYIRIHGRFL